MSEEIKDWIQKKLDQGIEPERIKRSLRETGQDPSLVDEVRSPFGDVNEESDLEEEELDFSGRGVDQDEGSDAGKESSGEELFDEDGSGEGEGSGISMPSVPSPSTSVPVRYLGVLVILFLFLGAGYFLVPESVLPTGSALEDTTLSQSPGASSGGDCPDIGVRIQSVSTTSTHTSADVLVTGGRGRVVLEIYSGDVLSGSVTRKIGGEGSITVRAVGDRAVLHPVGCPQFSDDIRIS